MKLNLKVELDLTLDSIQLVIGLEIGALSNSIPSLSASRDFLAVRVTIAAGAPPSHFFLASPPEATFITDWMTRIYGSSSSPLTLRFSPNSITKSLLWGCSKFWALWLSHSKYFVFRDEHKNTMRVAPLSLLTGKNIHTCPCILSCFQCSLSYS